MDYGKALKYIILNSAIKDADVNKFKKMVEDLNKYAENVPILLYGNGLLDYSLLDINKTEIMAWGFDKLFAEVKVKDAPLLRSEMRSYLGSKGQYYRYKLGQQKLVPEQQEHIKQLFARFGYKDVDFEYFAEEIDFTSI